MNDLKTFIESLIKDIGIEENINLEAIPDIELPDNFNEEFHNKFLTFVSARNNQDLMDHFKVKYLSSVDNKLRNIIRKMNINDDDFQQLKESSNNDTLKLIDLVFEKTQSIPADDGINSSDDSVNQFNKYKQETSKQIEELLKNNESSKENFEQQLNEINNNWKQKFSNIILKSQLSGYNFSDSYDRKDVEYLILKSLDESPYLPKLQDDLKTFKIYNRSEPESEFIKNGKNVDLKDVLDELSVKYIKKNNVNNSTTTNVVPINNNEESNNTAGYKYVVGDPHYGR